MARSQGFAIGDFDTSFPLVEGKAVHLVAQHGARLVHPSGGAYRYEVEVPETHRLAVQRPPIYREALR